MVLHENWWNELHRAIHRHGRYRHIPVYPGRDLRPFPATDILGEVMIEITDKEYEEYVNLRRMCLNQIALDAQKSVRRLQQTQF